VLSLREACRDVRPTAHSLSFASPKESKQRKGDPAVCDPGCAGATCGARGRWRARKLAFGSNSARPFFQRPLRSSAQPEGDGGESRAIASLGVGAMQLVAGCAMFQRATAVFAPQSCRAQRRHMGSHRRYAESSSAGQDGRRGARCLSRRRVCAPPALAEQRSEPFAQRRVDASGSPFFCILFFGEAKKRMSPAGARPGL
jgi:hypothetical protein